MQPAPDTELVLGVPVSTLDMASTVHLLDVWLQEDSVRLVCTADSSGLAQSAEDPELRALYQASALNTADSQGVVTALRQRGHLNATRVSGVDLLDELVALSAKKGYRIFFVGAARGVAEEAAEKFRLRHPGCNIVGTHHGFFPPADDELIAETIAKVQPDMVFAAMGIPRQEKFLQRILPITGAKIGMGVGGSLDVFSGRVKRAPGVIQKLRIEWLWRLLLNPRKLSKVRMLPKFWRYNRQELSRASKRSS